MKIFGREPTLIIQAISAGLSILVAFAVPGLDAETAGLMVAAISATFGVINALMVRPVAPTAFVGLVGAVAALTAAYGLEFSQEQVGAATAATVAVLTLLSRAQVTPVGDPDPRTADQHVEGTLAR